MNRASYVRTLNLLKLMTRMTIGKIMMAILRMRANTARIIKGLPSADKSKHLMSPV